MSRHVLLGLVLLMVAAGCSNGPASGTDSMTSVVVQGKPVAEFFQATCAACHAPDRSGLSGPALLPDNLVEDDAFYIETIRDGRPTLGMPAWAALGLLDEEIVSLVAFLRTEPGDVAVVAVDGEGILEGATSVNLGPIEQGASKPFLLELTNPTGEAVEITRFTSPSLSLFILDALPVAIDPGESRSLSAVFVPPPAAEIGAAVGGNAVLDLVVGDRDAVQLVTVSGSTVAPETTLAWSEQGLPSLPARLATWDRYLYVGYVDGRIDIFEFTGLDELTRVEQTDVIALTPNHGPDGSPNPEQSGRLIGGMAVGDDGTLYVTHSDPRLNEGEFAQSGSEADLNSGMITALEGPPGSYGAPGGRRDLVLGLPRNVTNHVPLGLAVDSGRLFVNIGALTDSGVPDPSKPDPETELSGTVLRLDLDSDPALFPIVLTDPGAAPATASALIPGVLDIWATGVRNAFGLTIFGGELYLTDQGSDGGGVPSPGEGMPGFGPYFGPDHLHVVPQDAFLGQPNPARGETVLEDGSVYPIPVPSPGFVPPIHKFGIHNSATGIVFYEGDLFPELDQMLLVARFSGTVGLHALRLERGRAFEVRVIAGPSGIGNITDVVVGPDGQIVMAAFWDLKLLVATGWQD